MSDQTSTQTHLTWREREQRPVPPAQASKLRLPAALCALLLGPLAVHKFLLGYRAQAIVLLFLSLLTLGAAGLLLGVIEGVLYLTKSDEEFTRTYVVGRRGWF